MSSSKLFWANNRGGLAPRRGGGRGGGTIAKRKEEIKPDISKHPLGTIQETILNSDSIFSIEDPSQPVVISHCEYLASYNWLSRSTPTIIVPGKPPQWNPLKQPRRLNRDSDEYFRDPNAARYPNYPMQPAVQAVLRMNTDAPGTRIDLFACGNTIGNLLRFVRGINKPFRFNVEVIDHTVFFIRKENDPREIIPDVKGYGHTFPEAYTTWDCDTKGSETHQRIIQYKFGELRCAVRYECDGYIASLAGPSEPPLAEGAKDDTKDSMVNKASLPYALLDISEAAISRPIILTNDALVTEARGAQIPQHSLFDLKTRSGRFKREIDMSDIYPSLWIKQIPNFIVAYHDGEGLFKDIDVKNVEKEVCKWEKDNAGHIQRLYVLLERIIGIAKKTPGCLLEVYFPGDAGLEIREQYGDGVHALPIELMNMWEDHEQHSNQSDSDASIQYEYDFDDGYTSKGDWEWASEADEPDYTACSADDCGYCGKCTY